MLSRMRISSKLAFTIAFTLFFFVAVTTAYTLVLQRTLSQNHSLRSHEIRVQHLASEVAVQMLQARRLEKDFLLRKDLKLLDPLRQAVQRAIQHAQEMIQLRRPGEDEAVADKAQQIIQAMHGYLQALQSLTDGYQQFGLHDEEGLQAPLHQASRAMGRWLRAPEAGATLVQLWQSEKGYWLARDSQSVQEVGQALQQLRTLLGRLPGKTLGKEEESLLNDYERHWQAVVAREQQNHLLNEKMRQAIHSVEPLIDEIRQVSEQAAQQRAEHTQSFGEQSAVFLLLFSLLTVAICALVCAIILHSISRSLQTLQQFAQSVSAGHWDALIPLGGCDELGGLANAMRTLVNQVRAVRLLSDRLLLILLLIARGTVPAKVESPVPGEFTAVAETLNAVVDTLTAVRDLAQQWQALAEGQRVAPLPEHLYPGEFKALAQAFNRLLSRLPQGE
ncbi:HAMP domain-containing protein [Candidatus Magnetaquicoccus inordinatus]|uniref:HAMP domain-containing protein n=1 Tax=Candidatus Magnetaquicoccus inordinatus TaxID=2496818 RepID=UPI00102CE5AD|nr:HAMP domain-containing protein [Candidatus Magnetaquicoccus inordinatus]